MFSGNLERQKRKNEKTYPLSISDSGTKKEKKNIYSNPGYLTKISDGTSKNTKNYESIISEVFEKPKVKILPHTPDIETKINKSPYFPETDNVSVRGVPVSSVREGTRIKNNIKNIIAEKDGELDARHIFDNIDDDTIERNIPLAQSTIDRNLRNGTLTKQKIAKLPNLRDGLAMFYAADEKGNSKAARKSIDVAYTEIPEILNNGILSQLQVGNLYGKPKVSFNDILSEYQKKYEEQTANQNKTEKPENNIYDAVYQNLIGDASTKAEPVNAFLTNELIESGYSESQKMSQKVSFNADDINKIISKAEKHPSSLTKQDRELLEAALKNASTPLQTRKRIESVLSQKETKITEADPDLTAQAKIIEREPLKPEKSIDEKNAEMEVFINAASFLPGVGDVADIGLAALDAMEGDWDSAVLSVLGLFPGADTVTDPMRIARKADNAIDAMKVVDDVVDFSKFPKTIHSGRHGKHIVGHNNYKKGNGILNITEEKANDLLKKFSGKGIPKNGYREQVDFGEIIGQYVDPKTGKAYDTTNGIIHYSKDGAHIVPARPTGYKG